MAKGAKKPTRKQNVKTVCSFLLLLLCSFVLTRVKVNRAAFMRRKSDIIFVAQCRFRSITMSHNSRLVNPVAVREPLVHHSAARFPVGPVGLSIIPNARFSAIWLCLFDNRLRIHPANRSSYTHKHTHTSK